MFPFIIFVSSIVEIGCSMYYDLLKIFPLQDIHEIFSLSLKELQITIVTYLTPQFVRSFSYSILRRFMAFANLAANYTPKESVTILCHGIFKSRMFRIFGL
jgi:hypothetical protein